MSIFIIHSNTSFSEDMFSYTQYIYFIYIIAAIDFLAFLTLYIEFNIKYIHLRETHPHMQFIG